MSTYIEKPEFQCTVEMAENYRKAENQNDFIRRIATLNGVEVETVVEAIENYGYRVDRRVLSGIHRYGTGGEKKTAAAPAEKKKTNYQPKKPEVSIAAKQAASYYYLLKKMTENGVKIRTAGNSAANMKVFMYGVEIVNGKEVPVVILNG